MSTQSGVRWYGERVTMAVRNKMKKRLEKAGRFAVKAVRENIATQAPPASLPGEFPHRQSGDLYRSTEMRLDRRSLTVRIVASAPHAEHVERNRPFLRRTLRKIKPQLREILLGNSGGSGRYKLED